MLEIGTGSGYSAAVLAQLAADVLSAERIEELGAGAAVRLADLGVANAEVVITDGSRGPARARALRRHRGPRRHTRGSAQHAGPARRRAAAWWYRSRPGTSDLLTVFRRDGDSLRQQTIGPCRFVPLIGSEGFDAPA